MLSGTSLSRGARFAGQLVNRQPVSRREPSALQEPELRHLGRSPAAKQKEVIRARGRRLRPYGPRLQELGGVGRAGGRGPDPGRVGQPGSVRAAARLQPEDATGAYRPAGAGGLPRRLDLPRQPKRVIQQAGTLARCAGGTIHCAAGGLRPPARGLALRRRCGRRLPRHTNRHSWGRSASIPGRRRQRSRLA